jgi:Ca-activated chloride channel homolog
MRREIFWACAVGLMTGAFSACDGSPGGGGSGPNPIDGTGGLGDLHASGLIADSDSDTELLDWTGGWTPEAKWGEEGELDEHDTEDGSGDADGDTDSDTGTDLDVDTDADGDAGYDPGGDASPPPPPPPPTGDLPELGTPERKVLYLSADDSNSQSSPALVRSMINDPSFGVVPRGEIRVWEFLNYYDFQYDPPAGDAAVSLTQQFRPYNMEEGLYALQIGVQGRHVTEELRRSVNVTLVLDTSGSMGGTSIELLKATCRAVASSLREGDRASMVEWNDTQSIVLDSLGVDGPDDPALLAAIDGLDADGSTNLNAGLVTGYELAASSYLEGGLNRVVLISDGQANVGVTDEQIIAEAAAGAEGRQIYLVGVGVGAGSYYDDTLMNAVTDAGKGAAVFIDSAEEAQKMFGERFLSTMEVTALDVQVEVTLPLYFGMEHYFGEECSESPEEVDPQHLAPDDAMVFQQLVKTLRPEQVYADYTVDLKVTYTDALTGLPGEVTSSSALQDMVDAPCDELRKGDAVIVYAQTLWFVDQLIEAGSGAQAVLTCQTGLASLQSSAAALGDADLEEIAGLLETYCGKLACSSEVVWSCYSAESGCEDACYDAGDLSDAGLAGDTDGSADSGVHEDYGACLSGCSAALCACLAGGGCDPSGYYECDGAGGGADGGVDADVDADGDVDAG